MKIEIPWKRIPGEAWNYAVTAFLVCYVVVAVVTSLIGGDEARPVSPPDGYVAHETRLRLAWTAGDPEQPFWIKVAEDGDFTDPVYSKSMKATSVVLPQLEPGKRYCWTVEQEGSSSEACFLTAEHAITF